MRVFFIFIRDVLVMFGNASPFGPFQTEDGLRQRRIGGFGSTFSKVDNL
jgi:hypothetical protein